MVQGYPDSGSVQVGSTKWAWRISEVRSLPEGTVSSANLDFHDPENERNTMWVPLGEPFSPPTFDEIKELGRNPYERRLIAPDGAEWVLNPLRTPPERVSLTPKAPHHTCTQVGVGMDRRVAVGTEATNYTGAGKRAIKLLINSDFVIPRLVASCSNCLIS